MGWIPIVQHRIVHPSGGCPVDPCVDLFTFRPALTFLASTLAMEDVLRFGDDLTFVASCGSGIGIFRCSRLSSLLAFFKLFDSGLMVFFILGANFIRFGATAVTASFSWPDWGLGGLDSPGLSLCFHFFFVWVWFLTLCLGCFVCCCFCTCCTQFLGFVTFL
ncbi:hypothetical protein RchiOBHm_Chr2g0110611 [Rosa chinensis]|uniref:Transmembrane protein n=1 Tax=Rosa chinensis TaxID=74649 RepID=A0A2P6RPR1_ROSCH|nr:hypothetical protein RchiOBHm_Chr2g0110611 [Rosa chinensis]